MALKQVVDYHIGRLSDKNPAVRMGAIEQLRLLGSPDALNALRHVVENDQDVDVRRAAQEAGRAIYFSSKDSARNA